MTAPIWTTSAGFLGTLTESRSVLLSVQADGSNVSYSLISGSLPIGLYLSTSTGQISGSPVAVPQNRTSQFVIRATSGADIADRTFNLTVDGPDAPLWLTPAGALSVGLNGEYYSINKEYVDFTVRAETDILAPGNHIKYFIADNDGQLPPGLKLTTDGRITGFVNDLLKLDTQASITGGYDEEFYDRYPYDHSTFTKTVVDNVKPESISKIYQFYITATDGIISSKRLFSIKVVDPDSLRADNTYILSDIDSIDASAGYLLAPLWQSAYGNLLPPVSNLGTVRATKKQVITLHEYDPYQYQGSIEYDWNSIGTNPDIKFITDSQIDIVGLPEHNLKGQEAIYFKNAALIPVAGMQVRFSDFIPGFDSTTYVVTGVIPTGPNSGVMNINQPLAADVPDSQVAYVGTPSQHPPGLSLNSAGELYGVIAYQPAYSTSYRFTVRLIKTDVANTANKVINDQIFILTVKGNVDSSIQFISPTNLGSIFPGQVSELAIMAQNINTTNAVEYELVQGTLPEGLTLNIDGTISGRINYRSQHVITNDGTESTTSTELLILDGNSTTIDKDYRFIIRAYDAYKLSAVEKEFYITIVSDLNADFTRIYVKPFLKVSRDLTIDPIDKRAMYRSFVSDPSIFDPTVIYRPNDPEFGVQPQIKMMLETGIQQVDLNLYATAMQNYFHRKNFYFGDVKVIPAQDSAGVTIYELVYVDIIDNQMIEKTTTADAISLANMQGQLEAIQLDPNTPILVNEHLRPRYMNTLNSTTGVPLGFIKAVPLCYTIPGAGVKILSRINYSGFDFKQFNFDTDRIIIETTVNSGQTSWLAYPQ